ncbi:MAG TPA: DUF4760 domain-containing protein [Sphingomonas sp.]|nr:DUF4760 domain-containing protein [Sphingomonas sp.]
MLGLGFDLPSVAVRQRGGSGGAPAATITGLQVLDAGVLPDGADAAVPNGWVAKATLPDDGVSAFDPTKIVLTVQDPGFDTAGNATVVTRTIRGTAVIRKQYPNHAQSLNSAAGGTRTVYFALADDIFQGSTITAAQAEAGYYGAAAAGTIGGVVNSSTVAYPKPLFGWLNLQHERATGAGFNIEAVAYHRFARNGQQVACIKFQAKDAQAVPNATAAQLVSAPALSDFQTAGQRVEAWKATIPLAALAQGDLCQVGAIVYPWIGTAWDLEVEGLAWPTACPQTKLRFKNDKNATYGGAVAYVKTGGTATTSAAVFAAQQDSATLTAAQTFATLATALTAIASYIEKAESTEHYRALAKAFGEAERTGKLGLLNDPKTDTDKDLRRGVLDYLNHYELVALGIKHNILDERIYREWIQSHVVREWNAAAEFIQNERWRLNEAKTDFEYKSRLFCQLQAAVCRWSPEALNLDENYGPKPALPADRAAPGDAPLPTVTLPPDAAT